MDSGTIVAAALDSTQLEQSINKLVQTVASKTKEMADNFTSEVGRMEQAVKNLGNIKIDSGGAADVGSSRRTKMLSDESLKAKEVAMTYDQMQAAFQKIAKDNSGLKDIRTFNKEELQSYIDLLRKLQAEYVRVNTQEGGGAKSDQIKRDMAELEKIIQGYQTILRNVEAINSRQGTIDVKKWTQDIGAVDDRYKKLVRWYTVLEKEDQRRIANEEKANQKRLAELNKEETARQKMIESARKAEEKYQNAVLKTAFNKIVDLPSNNIDQMRTKLERLQTILANIRELGILSPKDISNAETEIGKLRGNIQQIEKIEKERIEAEKRFVVEQSKEVEQTQTLEGRIRSLTQATKQYFAESKGSAGEYFRMFTAYGKSFTIYNPEKSNRANGLSIEEQITNILKEEKAAREGVAQSAQQQISATQNVAKAQQEESAAIRKNFRDYDSLREAIASVLGIKSENVRLQGAEISSINVLSDRLKQLRSVYNQLGTDDRHSETGKALIAQIQNVERQMDRARKELSRPIDLKSAFALSEKTLDDIAYKMRQLASYKMGLNIKDPKAMEEMRQVDAEINRLKKNYDDLMSKNSQMVKSNNALGRSWNYMKNRLAFYVTVGAGTQFIKSLIEVRSQYEMNEKALGILLDSASRGTRIFNELSQMSLVSPYTLIELSSAAKQLTAYDIAAKDVVDTTRRLADMASAVGVPVERLTYALGQIKAYGYLNSRDARMFANAGIPLVKQLADYYSELEGKVVSTADVYDRMKKKAIDYNDVMKVVTKMTDEGGKFFDFQAKMADTLKVRLANLTLAWNNMLNDLGKSNQGTLTTGIKSLTVIFRHWREIYRILSTLIVALGAYKAATMLVGMTTKGSIGRNAMASWMLLKRNIDAATGATAKFSVVLKSIPFTAWVTMIATLASYFYLFNNSTDGLKQKLEDIATAFDGVRKEITDLYADALKSDSIGSQLTKLRDMLELAQTELGVTIPIKLEEVNEGNVKQKLKEVKNIIDNYLNFSQEFSEAAAGTKFNELMNEFGANARTTYTGISESINTVVVALQDLVDKGNASRRDLEILYELTSGQKEDESRIEYLQRLVRLYEELGLVGKKVTTPSLSFSSSSTDNMNELTEKQNQQLDRLGIKNKQVFENMLKDVQDYYSSSSIAQYQFEQQVERVAKRIDINNIPEEQRTLKLSAAINEEASLNNWNQFEKEFARQVANERFGTTIEISDESKGVAEQDLKDWQKKQQEWAAKNGITIPINFQTNDTEISYAKRMLQAAKDAKEEVEVQQRKLAVGTGSQDAVDAAKKAYENARILAKNAGADLEQLDKKANATAKKAAKAAESELAKALKDELSTIDKVRSIYKDLTKEGMSHADAVERATRGWKETVNAINKVLQKNGLQKLDLSKFAGIENPRELVNMLQSQLNTLLKRGAKPAEIKELQTKVNTLEVDSDKYDLTKITKGLNNELDRLKDEYELAVSLDADPELGNVFADMMGINIESLPHTVKEYADEYSKYLNKYLKGKNSALQFTGDELRSLTRDDITAFREQVDAGSFNQEWFDAILKAYEDISGKRKKDLEETEKWKNGLIEKYGNLQDKLTKIYKDSVQNQVNAVKTFGTEDQKSNIVRLQLRLEATDNPAELSEINTEIAKIVKDVIEKNPIALKLVTASNNQTKADASKAYWEDFKNSELYAMTFEDMANNSTRAIQLIIDKLNELKDKVKEDPASMKALIKSLEDAENELNSRDPFAGIVNSIKNWTTASNEAKVAQEELRKAEQSVAEAQSELDDAEDGTPEEQALAQKNLTDAIKKRGNAEAKVVQTENKAKKAQEQLKNSLQNLSNELGNVSGLLGSVSQIFRAVGDDDTADAIDAINEGFTIMTTVIMGVVAALVLLEASNPWLLAIAAALSVIVGLVSFLSGNSNKKITKQVEESERAVKRLENAYRELEFAAENAYGTAVAGANQAMKANKELQLVELKRQLALEQSRSSKNKDEDKIIDLTGQIIDLENEISKATSDTLNNLLGISSHGDFFEGMISDMISAFKNGEDAMKVFEEKWAEMIDNMIMKTIVSQVLQNWVDSLEDGAQKILDKFTAEPSKAVSELTNQMTDLYSQDAGDISEWIYDNDREAFKKILDSLGVTTPNFGNGLLGEGLRSAWFDEAWNSGLAQKIADAYKGMLGGRMDTLTKNLDKASLDATGDLIDYYSMAGEDFKENYLGVILERIKENWTFGQDSQKDLSQLQQGIQSISESTANALEGYMNGVSQQVYLHSDLLTQIRDTIVGWDFDVQTATMGEILLQLRSSYEVQMAIHGILDGWSSPSGLAVRVEMQ